MAEPEVSRLAEQTGSLQSKPLRPALSSGQGTAVTRDDTRKLHVLRSSGKTGFDHAPRANMIHY